MRFGVHLGPFWVSFGGRRKRKPAALNPAGQRALERQNASNRRKN